MNQVTESEVRKIAKLSALDLTDEEVKLAQTRLQKILQYVAQLNEVNTTGVAEFHPVDVDEHTRDDYIIEELSVEDILQNAPEKDKNCFKIPKVL